MPSYSLPDFNLSVSAWGAGHTPSADSADFTGIAAQYYVNSRQHADSETGTSWAWTPGTFLRISPGFPLAWTSGQIWEIPEGSGRYYRAKWKETVHLGFPNEYFIVAVDQCNSLGVPENRHVTYP